MNTNKTNTFGVSALPFEIISIFQKTTIDIFNYAHANGKLVNEEASYRLAEIIKEKKDAAKVHTLITHQLSSQINHCLDFSVNAYKISLNGHKEIHDLLHKNTLNGSSLLNIYLMPNVIE